MEIREREEAQEEESKAAVKAVTIAELMEEANLEGVDTLWDDMTTGDEDWAKLGQVRSAAHHTFSAAVLLWPVLMLQDYCLNTSNFYHTDTASTCISVFMLQTTVVVTLSLQLVW